MTIETNQVELGWSSIQGEGRSAGSTGNFDFKFGFFPYIFFRGKIIKVAILRAKVFICLVGLVVLIDTIIDVVDVYNRLGSNR